MKYNINDKSVKQEKKIKNKEQRDWSATFNLIIMNNNNKKNQWI